MTTGVGGMRESLELQAEGVALRIASITRSGTVATATTVAAHGRSTGDYVTIVGAVPSGYNGRFRITVTGAKTFTFTVSNVLATPATTPGTSQYLTDASGGHAEAWFTVTNIFAEEVSLSANERLQLQAIQPDEAFRFKAYATSLARTGMRIVYTPNWPPGASTRTLGITGIRPVPDEPDWMWIDAIGRAA